MPRLAGKTAVITGAARSIGAAIARAFAAEILTRHSPDAQPISRLEVGYSSPAGFFNGRNVGKASTASLAVR
jgi:NAD(P)-dependent dehydrogenase (short-subunit alcohol dehydrogenase family)